MYVGEFVLNFTANNFTSFPQLVVYYHFATNSKAANQTTNLSNMLIVVGPKRSESTLLSTVATNHQNDHWLVSFFTWAPDHLVAKEATPLVASWSTRRCRPRSMTATTSAGCGSPGQRWLWRVLMESSAKRHFSAEEWSVAPFLRP